MNGEFGAIYQDGKQVGGFLDWNITFNLENTSAGGYKAYTVTRWRANVQPHYWIGDTDGDFYVVDFYKYYEGQLVIASRNEVYIDRNLSDDLNKWIDRRLEMKLV